MTPARLSTLVLAMAAAIAASCTSARDERSTAATSSSPPAPASAPGFDIASLGSRAHFAFRESGGAFVGAHATYVTRVAADGSVRVSPRWPEKAGATPGKRPRRGPIRPGEPVVSLSTTAIERGRSLPLVAPRVSVATDGTAAIDRGAVVEHVQNVAQGVEQSWEVSSRPAGRGDLVLRVALETTGRVEPEGSGLRIVDEASRRAVRYSAATWVDAAGTRTELPVHFADGRIVLRVPDEVLERSTYPAVLDPTVSPELSFDDPLVDIPGYWWDQPEVVAGKNGSFLVAWVDERVFSIDSNLYFGSSQVYGARISSTGAVLDPTGLAIAPTRDFDLGELRLAFDGENWFAAWTQYPYNGPCTQLVGARVSEAGVVLDPANISVSCVPGNRPTQLGFDGAAFLLTWHASSLTTPSSYAEFGQYVTKSGKLGAKAPFTIQEDVSFSAASTTQLGCDRVARCLRVGASAGGLRGRFVAQDGVLGDEIVITSTATDSPRAVDFDGTSFVVAYRDAANTTRALRIVPATGEVLDPGGIPVAPNYVETMASTTGQTLFAWANASGQIAAVRMTSAGVLQDATPLALTAAADAAGLTAAASGGQYLLAWEDGRGGPSRETVYVSRVSTAGQSLDADGKLVRAAANGQRRSALSGDGSGWLVAWEDLRTHDYDPSVRATRLDASGNRLDPSSFEIAAYGNDPDVAYGGAGYLVAYSDGGCFYCCGNIKANAVSKAGVTSPPLTLSTGCAFAPRVTFDGTNYVIVWLDQDVKMARVSPAGAIVDTTPIKVGGDPSGWGESVGVATNGQELFVTWSATTPEGYGVVGTRVSKSGQVLDAEPIVVNTGPYDIYNPTVAWDGKNYLLAWQDYRNAFYTNPDVYFARVSPAGTVLDPYGKPLANTPAYEAFPTVIAMNDGVSALVAWSEPRRTDRFRDFGIFGSFIRIDDGTVLDPGGIELADAPGNELMPALAPRSPGNVLLTFQRYDDAAGMGAERIRGRFVASGTLPGNACTKDDDCSSRSCADGVCCDAPCKGTCQTCTAIPGKCTQVKDAEDADTCSGERRCDATATCKTKEGRSCQVPGDCVSGFCADGICCDGACNGSCETCAAPPGKCTLRGARSTGAPSCAPYACDGAGAACPTSCASDDACPSGARCDPATGSCVAGAYCIDSTMLGGIGPEPQACAPYTCESGACRTTCRDVHDCAFPSVCNEQGACMQPPPSALGVIERSGCAAAPRGRAPNGLAALAGLLTAALALRARSGTRCRGRRARTSCR